MISVTQDRFRLAQTFTISRASKTEALATPDLALRMGFRGMVGSMVGSPLAMAPAVLLAQGVAWTDLDGPLLLAEDRPYPLRHDAEGVHPPDANLWG